MMRIFHNATTKRKKRTNIPAFALWGMIGFGIGGAIGGAIWVTFDAPHLGFAILGAIGGASLGVALQGWKKAWVLALACAIGFDIGFLIGFFIPLAVWEPIHGQGFLVGAIGGALGGASIGVALKDWKSAGILSLASAIGFGIAVWITWDKLHGLTPQILWGSITLAIWGAIGGTCLGSILGYLETRKSNIEIRTN